MSLIEVTGTVRYSLDDETVYVSLKGLEGNLGPNACDKIAAFNKGELPFKTGLLSLFFGQRIERESMVRGFVDSDESRRQVNFSTPGQKETFRLPLPYTLVNPTFA